MLLPFHKRLRGGPLPRSGGSRWHRLPPHKWERETRERESRYAACGGIRYTRLRRVRYTAAVPPFDMCRCAARDAPCGRKKTGLARGASQSLPQPAPQGQISLRRHSRRNFTRRSRISQPRSGYFTPYAASVPPSRPVGAVSLRTPFCPHRQLYVKRRLTA